MAPTLPSLDVRRLRSYVFRLPLFTRIILVFVGIFWILALPQVWDVVQWGALVPKEVNLGTMYRLNTYPLIHRGFFHALFNTLALVPLLERFEAEHGTLLTGAMFAGRTPEPITFQAIRDRLQFLWQPCLHFQLLDICSLSAEFLDAIQLFWEREVPTILALRRDPRLLQIPPYLSALCIVVGVIWLLLLPLNQYSRHTYISENALLPGQVHTYFGGSEQNVFNAYKHEVQALAGKEHEEIAAKLSEIFASIGLKSATQRYEYHAAGSSYSGENAYAILHAPRGDATEAIVLVAAWMNMDDELNQGGVALALTLARYFKRWSLWSKDIIILITSDSKAGPQAWVDAYHDEHSPDSAASLPLKSGALQAAVVVDNALDHKFESLHIVYDGINGQLPNLDLFNTAAHIASGQMGISVSLQRMWKHGNGYRDRLQTMLRGMVSQGLGHTSGPHSSFIPYHVDAITLQAVGNGWQDEMVMGRCVESTFRSLNNLMEHFHQSFFFYLLMQAQRFVSIGTYLPSAMLVAVSFTIMAIALWILSGRPPKPQPARAAAEKVKESGVEVVKKDGMVAIVPKEDLATVERRLLFPIALVVSSHFLGSIPLYIFNNTRRDTSSQTLAFSALANVFLPTMLAIILSSYTTLSAHRLILLQCFSLLLLGMFLATLATLNFSLAFLVGLLAAPLPFTGVPVSAENNDGPLQISFRRKVVCNFVLHLLSPPVVVWALCRIFGVDAGAMLVEAAFGWKVSGLWTQVVVCCIWWPAWLVGAVIVSPVL
ncbi:MAG: hypothetical protein Q9211_001576 [Gyalolechia sp. 1 TL-2023]